MVVQTRLQLATQLARELELERIAWTEEKDAIETLIDGALGHHGEQQSLLEKVTRLVGLVRQVIEQPHPHGHGGPAPLGDMQPRNGLVRDAAVDGVIDLHDAVDLHGRRDAAVVVHPYLPIRRNGDVMNNVYRRAAERDNHQVISTIDFIVNYEEVLNKKSQKATFSGGILKGKTIRTANGGLGPGFKDKYLVKDDGQVEYTLSTHKNSQIDALLKEIEFVVDSQNPFSVFLPRLGIFDLLKVDVVEQEDGSYILTITAYHETAEVRMRLQGAVVIPKPGMSAVVLDPIRLSATSYSLPLQQNIPLVARLEVEEPGPIELFCRGEYNNITFTASKILVAYGALPQEDD